MQEDIIMISGNPPDIDPANNDTLAGSMRFAFFKLLQGVNGVLPAQVLTVSDDRTRVTVQPLIAVVSTTGAQIQRPRIENVPVATWGGGDLFLSFPLVPGNLGWIIANDRDISLFLQTYNATAPNTGRIKNFADAVFVPDIMTGYTINSDDVNNAVLSNKDGSIRISIGANGVQVTAPTVTINGAEHVTGTITGDTGANLSGTIALTGLGTFPFVMTP
jgi:Phage protein Gp138 N-terminal domain